MSPQPQERHPGEQRRARPAASRAKRRPRPVGLLALLDAEDQEAVLAYKGPVGSGRKDYPTVKPRD